MKICSSCHHPLTDEANFCENCGIFIKRDSCIDPTVPQDNTDGTQDTSPTETHETQVHQQHVENQPVRHGISFRGCIIMVYGLVLLLIMCILLVRNVSSALTRQRILSRIEQREQLSTRQTVISDFSGNYSIRLIGDSGNRGRYRTAIVSRNGNDYDVKVITDFGPEHHSFHIDSNNKLVSETLGEGVVEYKDDINQTKITFRNGGKIWEIIK